jgi:Rieske 2Fe-2S family protein
LLPALIVASTEEAGMSRDGEVPLERSLPGPSYTSEAEFARERDRVLLPGWFCVGRADGLAEPGCYLAADVCGESIIVTRAGHGGLAGYYNLCRHRGSRLVPTAGCQALSGPATAGPVASGRFPGSVRCPYHGWTYALDGTLRAAPFLPALREHRAALSLHRVDVATWGGFVFARLERPGRGAARPVAGPAVAGPGDSLAATLGDLPARTAAYPLASLRSGARLHYEVAANWKVILENYNECYHCGPVHPELCELVPAFRRGGGDLDWAAGIPHRPGATTFTSTGTTRRAPFPGLPEAARTRHFGELVLPNLMLSLSADHVAAFTVWPRSAAATTVLCDFLFHPAELARPDFDPSDAVGFWDLVNRQDWSICEQVQDGMGSRRFTVGYLAPMEQPSADIGRYVAACLARADRPDASAPGRSSGPGEVGR